MFLLGLFVGLILGKLIMQKFGSDVVPFGKGPYNDKHPMQDK